MPIQPVMIDWAALSPPSGSPPPGFGGAPRAWTELAGEKVSVVARFRSGFGSGGVSSLDAQVPIQSEIAPKGTKRLLWRIDTLSRHHSPSHPDPEAIGPPTTVLPLEHGSSVRVGFDEAAQVYPREATVSGLDPLSPSP